MKAPTEDKPKSHDKLSFRLSNIITRLLLGERLKVDELSKEFGVTTRTIREDLNKRLSNLPITCENSEYFLKTLPNIKNYELANFSQKSGIYGLYPKIDYKILLNDTNLVSGFNYENIDEKLFKKLQKTIKENLTLHFTYNEKERIIKPYKLLNLNGIWYLVAVENETIKNFTISKVFNLKFGEKFKKESKFEALIKENKTFISENLITVKLKADKKISEFIQRREIFPNQRILETLENGDIILEMKSAFEPEILGLVLFWLPHISILEPLYLKEKLIKNLEIYLEKEKTL
ncbi:MAG: WYL domain-containing protein [Campylobacteraceae bacterium]|nr:WYL domain-containing protein [Campylobacteraceae bacterium]